MNTTDILQNRDMGKKSGTLEGPSGTLERMPLTDGLNYAALASS